jgi:hypothetical protein
MTEHTSDGSGPAEPNPADRSLGELFSEATGNMSRLVRLELELAKLELAQNVRQAAKGSGMFAAAAVFGHLVLVLASVTAGLGLWALGLAPWLAFLIVTVFYLLIAGVLVFIGIRQLKKMRGLPRTGETMADTVAVLQRRHPVGD